MATSVVEKLEAQAGERELVLDPVTQRRLEVAEAAADTLEHLLSDGAWERVDPTLAGHLQEHARRTCDFLERVRLVGDVRTHEEQVLAVRRLQRRLEVSLDILGGDEENEDEPRAGAAARSANGKGALFYGDFTDRRASRDQVAAAREKRRKKKEELRVFTSRGLRIAAWITGALVLLVGSFVLVAVTEVGRQPAKQQGPPGIEPNAYRDNLQTFLPARMTFVKDGVAQVLVDREWLLTPLRQRIQGAEGARVYLENRNIHQVVLAWQGGGIIATADRGQDLTYVDPAFQDRPSVGKAPAPGPPAPPPAP